MLQRFDLFGAVKPFRRCMRCNGLLVPVAKEAVSERLAPKTRRYYDEFYVCQGCDQVYWKGSHYRRMQGFIERIVGWNANRTADGRR